MASHPGTFQLASPPPGPLRLTIIEDFRSMAEMLQLLCTRYWGMEVTAVAHGAAAGLAAVAATQPDLILLDLALPDIDGLNILPHLRGAAQGVKIIILTALCNDYVLGQLRDLSWDGLLDKSTDGLNLLREAIRTVTAGRRYISPAVQGLLSGSRDSRNPIAHMLSEREKEVLVCIAHAMTDEEVARHLGIDQSTAHSHRKALLHKLTQHSTPKLMHYAIRHGFASLPLPAIRPSSPALARRAPAETRGPPAGKPPPRVVA